MNADSRDATREVSEPELTHERVEAVGNRRLEVGVQVFFVILAIVTALNSLQLGLMVALGPGPGFFPFYLSIAMGLLALAWMVQSARATRRREGASVTDASEHDEEVDRPHVYNVIGSLIVLAAVMNFLGYQLSMFLFLYYHLAIRAKRTWYTSLIIALAGSVGVFHVFNDLLAVQLPYSSFGFLNTIGL